MYKRQEQGVSSVQGALNSLNEKSDDLTGSSAQIKAALETIQKSLSPVAASAGQLKELTSASGSIKKGISDLYDCAAALHQNLGAAQYKAVMAQKGLDIDAVSYTHLDVYKRQSVNSSSAFLIISDGISLSIMPIQPMMPATWQRMQMP